MHPTREYGYVIIDTDEYKRKYSPRLATDEFWSEPRQQWVPVSGPGDFLVGGIYRRRITKQPRRFWASCGRLFDTAEEATQYNIRYLGTPEIIHLIETDPPPPEKSPAELAWEKYRDSGNWPESIGASFRLGYDAGRNAK